MKRRGGDLHGLLRVDKPAGPTSAELVDWARWALGGAPVGHFGTLDPAATGLLVLAVGGATRLNPYCAAEDKRYRATFVLGRETTTGDAQGEVIREGAVSADVWAVASRVLEEMQGTHALVPPAFSAVRVEGRRAHDAARSGEPLVLEPRPMTIHRIDAVVVDPQRLAVEATLTVSKGTYVRSLAVELGRRLGCPAHLGALRREASGTLDLEGGAVVRGFSVEPLGLRPDGKPKHRIRWTAADLDRSGQGEALRAALLPAWSGLPMPVHATRADPAGRRLVAAMAQGRAVPRSDLGWTDLPSAPRIGVRSAQGEALWVARVEDEWVRPERTIVPAGFARREPATEAENTQN